MRVGKIIAVEDLEGAIKPIYKLRVDLGAELGIREIAAGIKNSYTKEALLNKNVVVIANLDPKKIANFISQGMLLAAGDDDTSISLLQPDNDVKPGTKVR